MLHDDARTRLDQPIARCMTETFITLPEDATLRHAAKALRDRRIGLLLVTLGEELVGVISERDIVTAVADGDACDEVRLADRARGDIITIFGSETVQAGITRMASAGIRHLVVVNPSDHQPVGVISARDLLSELAGV